MPIKIVFLFYMGSLQTLKFWMSNVLVFLLSFAHGIFIMFENASSSLVSKDFLFCGQKRFFY